MKLFRYAMLAAGIAVAVSAHGQDNAIARVNGVAIPQLHIDLLMKNLVAQGRPDNPEMREQLKQEMINRELLAQEAARRGLDKTPEISARLNFARQEVLSQAVLQDTFRASPITNDIITKEYERLKPKLVAREVKPRHILVAKEEEAKEIIALIRQGSSFEKLAAERSTDPGSKTRGGDLDWGTPARFVKPFADALVKLKKGQMTEIPIRTQHGWHVIQMDDERARTPSLEEIRPRLQQFVQQQTIQKVLADLRAKAKIE